jgi:hypothetical protein
VLQKKKKKWHKICFTNFPLSVKNRPHDMVWSDTVIRKANGIDSLVGNVGIDGRILTFIEV